MDRPDVSDPQGEQLAEAKSRREGWIFTAAIGVGCALAYVLEQAARVFLPEAGAAVHWVALAISGLAVGLALRLRARRNRRG